MKPAGVTLPATWATATPLQPRSTISGTATVYITALHLSVGGVYPVTITATFANGSSATQTVSAILTLHAL